MGENDLSPVKSWGQIRFNDLNDLTNQFLPTQTMHTIRATSLWTKHQKMPSPMKSILPKTPSPTHKSQWYFIYCRFVLCDIQTDALFLFPGYSSMLMQRARTPKNWEGTTPQSPNPNPKNPIQDTNPKPQPSNHHKWEKIRIKINISKKKIWRKRNCISITDLLDPLSSSDSDPEGLSLRSVSRPLKINPNNDWEEGSNPRIVCIMSTAKACTHNPIIQLRNNRVVRSLFAQTGRVEQPESDS